MAAWASSLRLGECETCQEGDTFLLWLLLGKAETSLGCGGTGNNKSWDWLQRVRPAVDATECTLMMPIDQNVLGFSCEFVTREGGQNEDKWSALHCTDGAGRRATVGGWPTRAACGEEGFHTGVWHSDT